MGFYAKKYNEIMNAGGKFPTSKEILEAKVKLILKEFTHSSDTDYDNPTFTNKNGKDILSPATVDAALSSSLELLAEADEKSDQESNVQHASQVLKMLAQLMICQRNAGLSVDENLYIKAHMIIEELVEKVKENPKHPASNIVTTGEAWKQFFSSATQESAYNLILMTMPLNDEDSLSSTKDGELYGVPNLDKIHLEDPVEGNKIISAMMMADNNVTPSSDIKKAAEQAKEELSKVSNVKEDDDIISPKVIYKTKYVEVEKPTSIWSTLATLATGAAIGIAGYKAYEYFTDGTTIVTSGN